MADTLLTIDEDDRFSAYALAGWPWWRAKLLAEPDWVMGVLVGVAATLVVLLAVIPRQEYAKLVKNPHEALVAQQTRPLSAEHAFRLQRARVSLKAGRVDQALLDLETILRARPDEAEARWLYASTLDRLGDTVRSAQHYALYLKNAEPFRYSIDQRIQTARQRLGVLEESP